MKTTPINLADATYDNLDQVNYLVRVGRKVFVSMPTLWEDDVWFDDVKSKRGYKLEEVDELARIESDE